MQELYRGSGYMLDSQATLFAKCDHQLGTRHGQNDVCTCTSISAKSNSYTCTCNAFTEK